ncbi:MFS transporter [Aquihabitans sp. McL0605]|uniref:MFS transporter n=1 Tax=Aquihabitans sp. McL0605 TaxID=3415671 RepID=UPI003CFB5A25
MIAEQDAELDPHADPRRWFTLAIVLTAVLIAALDSTVLNVAIPTILREFDTTLPALQWVITGYSLTFAALLIIGGRLGDIFGARRMFIVGAAMFGVGSLIASLSHGVVVLVIGEAIIEGMGASLMLPATMGILSSTFAGRERATAFAAWGAVMGSAVAFGPLIGGFLTTNYSWRWAFRINVMVVPFAILGALLLMPRGTPSTKRRERIDVPGALLIATGMFLLVFAISEGSTYGWFEPHKAFEIAGHEIWSATAPISIVPVAFALSFACLFAFYKVQRYKERVGADPLFEFSNLARPGFRWGTFTLMLMAMGQVSFLFVMSVVLQDGQHLSAVDTGLWLVPSGLFIVAGSQIGNWLTRRIGTTNVVRTGLVLDGLGLSAVCIALSTDISLWQLLPGFALFGMGIGFAGSQLNNVILADVPADRAGAASGANTTVRMIGSALGIAIASSLLSTQTVRHAVDNVTGAGLPGGVTSQTVAQIRSNGVSFSPRPGLSGGQFAKITSAMEQAVVSGARGPLIFGAIAVFIGAGLAWLIPQVGPRGSRQEGGDDTRFDDETELVIAESEAMAESVTVQ